MAAKYNFKKSMILNCFRTFTNVTGMSQIKSRLKSAYESVEFYANDTWVQNSNAYQRANQELYIRESKVRDEFLEETSRPRTVQDTIPYSKLAKYSNYEYNEARELCYASNTSNISFYYPCMFKRNSTKEPWMLPEVEQFFIWYSYAPDFNILEVLSQEELNHVDEQDNKLEVDSNNASCWHDFHEIYPAFYETLERTPGKPKYRSLPVVTEEDIKRFSPSYLKSKTFEDMMLQMKIKSDKIKHLWCVHSQPYTENSNSEKRFFENYPTDFKQRFFRGDNFLVTEDFKQLQHLTDGIRSLENVVSDNSKNRSMGASSNVYSSSFNSKQELINEPPPARRLYSAVLQGLSTTTVTEKRKSSSTDITPPSSTSTKDAFSLSIPSTSTKTESSSVTSLPSANKSATVLQFPSKCLFPNVQNWHGHETKSSMVNLKSLNSQKIEFSNLPLAFKSATGCSSDTTCPGGVVNSSSSTNLPNLPPSYQLSAGYAGSNLYTNNVCINNVYGANNSYDCLSSLQNNYYANSNSCQVNQTHSRNVIPQYNRQYLTNQLLPQSVWMFQQHNRPTTVYPFAHFASQPYFVQPTTPQMQPRHNQRWSPQTHYARQPSNLHSCPLHMHPSSPSSSQQWGVANQNLYKTNSTQFFESPSSQSLRPAKMKTKKGLNFLHHRGRCRSPDRSSYDDTEIPTTYTKQSSSSSETAFPMSSNKSNCIKSAASTSSIEFKKTRTATFDKPRRFVFEQRSSEVFLKTRNDNSSFPSSDSGESRTVPVAATFSEELERQALEQYQASDENFYQELERQAEEQYDDRSENWIGLPNKKLVLFGGLSPSKLIYSLAFLLVYFDINVFHHSLFLLY